MNKRIDEIRERGNAATKGPWKNGLYRSVMATYSKICNTERDADAIFVAHAREDIPYLLAEIESLQAQLTAYQNTGLAPAEDVNALQDMGVREIMAELLREEDLRAQLAESQRREQAAVENMQNAYDNGICTVCKGKDNWQSGCIIKNGGKCKFEWRGPQEKDTPL